MSFADGSAESVDEARYVAGYPQGEGEWFGSYFGGWEPGMHTIGGVRGRDVRR